MANISSSDLAVEAVVGYAAGTRGNGVLYARLKSRGVERLVRVGFRATTRSPVSDRAIGYAALAALFRMLCKRGFREVRLVLGDGAFVDEVATGRGVDETMAIPYVRLRCVLNTFAKFAVRAGTTDDLTQRARAEAALNVAA